MAINGKYVKMKKAKTYISTPKNRREIALRTLNEEKARLVEIVRREQVVLIQKMECLYQIEYWENMLK